MKYLKYFEHASDYEAYKNGSDYVLPNVSYIVDGVEVKFNPNAALANLIEFIVDGISYQAEEGMTWGEFAASKYANEEDFYVNTEDGNSILRYQGASLRNTSRERQDAYSVIVDGEAYTKIEEE